MIKLMNCFFVFILFLISTVNAQTISSKVVDKKNNQPLQYATVAIKNTGKGVITNEDGNFHLNITDTNNSIIVISYLGYGNIELQANKIPSIIYLEEATKALQTIIVSVEAPISILKKAFERIEKNYPQKLTKQIVFYRESNLTETGEYMYISEGLLEVVRNKYNNTSKNDLGQVKALKSRTHYLKHLDYTVETNFYGGHFIWNKYDFVKKRMPFINPRHFDDYHFELLDTSIRDGKPVYVITFSNQDNKLKGEWSGKLYIDTESYAYIGADVKRNELGINKINKMSIRKEYRKEVSFKTRYTRINNLWYFNNCNYKSRLVDDNFEQDIIFDDEVVVTELITKDVKHIKFEDRLAFSIDFSKTVINNFDDDFFGTYTTLEESQRLKEEIERIKKDPDEEKLSKKDSIKLKTNKFSEKIKNKLSFSIGLTSLPITIEDANYQFTNQNNTLEFISKEKFSGLNRSNGIYGNLNFNLSKRWTLGIGQFYSLNRSVRFNFYDVNIRYNILLKKVGKPLILQTQIAYWFGKAGLRFENTDQEISSLLMIGERSFETDQTMILIGKRLNAVKPSLNFNYQLSSFVWLQAGIDFYLPISAKTRLFVIDDSSNSFTDARSFGIENDDFSIKRNEEFIIDDFPLNMGKLSFRLGVVIHL